MTNTTYDYDLVILGAGPAGATLARLVDSRRWRVLLLNGQPLMQPKPCGGLLAPDAQKALAGFELTLPKTVLVDPQIFAVKTIDLRSGKVRFYPRSYVNLDRARFDRWLLDLVPDSVTVATGRCLDVSRQAEGFSLRVADGSGRERTLTAAYLAGADGADSLVRRRLFPEQRMDAYVSIQQWFPVAGRNPFYSCIFDPETSDSCSWSICKDDFFIFGGAFRPKDCRAAFQRQKEKLTAWGFSFGEPIRTEACQVLRPHGPASFCLGRDRAFLLGEAAGLISPSSLEGISSAILSATWLARGWNRGPEQALSHYRRASRKLRLRLAAKCLKRWFMYTPWTRRLLMASGLSSIELVPDGPGKNGE